MLILAGPPLHVDACSSHPGGSFFDPPGVSLGAETAGSLEMFLAGAAAVTLGGHFLTPQVLLWVPGGDLLTPHVLLWVPKLRGASRCAWQGLQQSPWGVFF